MQTDSNLFEIHQAIINQSNSLIIIWIPSHVGIHGNEEADALAKLATEKEEITIAFKPDGKYIKHEIARYIQSKWQNRYDDTSTKSHYKLFEPKVDKITQRLNISRGLETFISRLKTETIDLNAFKYKRKIHPNGLCDHCLKEETVSHLLTECTKYNLGQKLNETDITKIIQNTNHLRIVREELLKDKRNI